MHCAEMQSRSAGDRKSFRANERRAGTERADVIGKERIAFDRRPEPLDSCVGEDPVGNLRQNERQQDPIAEYGSLAHAFTASQKSRQTTELYGCRLRRAPRGSLPRPRPKSANLSSL